MAREFSRTERVSGLIARQLAGIIQKEMNDPRLRFVTITGVEVTRDLEHAKVYFTVHQVEEKDEVRKALYHASPFLRRQLAKTKTLRIMPSLDFIYDDTFERGQHINQLINEAVKKHDEDDT